MATKHTYYIIASILALASLFQARAQEPVYEPEADTLMLTLDECRSMALSDNAAAKTADNNTRISRETSREAFTKYFPEISASGMSFWANHDVIQYNVLDMFELGMIKKGVTAGITAVQPIFAGGQIVNGNALAHLGEQLAELRKRQTDEEIIVTVDTYYWKLVSLQSQRETLKSLLVMLDTLAYQTQAAVDAGVILPNDLLRVQLQQNDFRATLIDLNNGISLCSNLLGQYIGAGLTPVNTAERIDTAQPLQLDTEIWRDPQQAVTATPSYKMLTTALRAAKLEKKIAIGSNLPTVGLGAGWFYHTLLEQKHNFGALFIAVNVPLSGWWSGSHEIKKKNLEIQNAQLQLSDGEQMLQIAMIDAWDNLTAAYRKTQTAAEAIVQSRENLRLNQNYYSVGVSTITDLLEAQTLYKRANDQYIAAYADYRLRTTEYLRATAQLFGTVD